MASLNSIIAAAAPNPTAPVVAPGQTVLLRVNATPDTDRTDVIEGTLAATGAKVTVVVTVDAPDLTYGLQGTGAAVELRVANGPGTLTYLGGTDFQYRA